MPNQIIFSIGGGSVQANNGLYIHRGADEELLELCRTAAFTYVLTPRQMGKSSLMERTAERLAEEGVTSIIIDLQEMGVTLTAEQWYFGLVAKIAEQTTLKTNVMQWWQQHTALGFGQRLTLFLREVLMAESGADERIVIFVDEIDTTLSLKFSDDFFTAIRSIYSSRASVLQFRRLSFVLIGVATPTDLISDPKRTPFNIGQRVDLTDFTEEEALPLAVGFGLPPVESQQVLRWALEWTGGHPFLTQHLCAAIASEGKSEWTKDNVDRVVAETFFGEETSKNTNLLFVRDMLTKRATDREAVLNTYNEVLRGKQSVVDEGQSVPKTHLKLSGVVCAEDGALRVRNRIYRHVFDEAWVKKHNPPNWTRRLTRVAAALIAILLFLSVPIGGFALYQWQRASAARDKATAALKDAQEQRSIAEARRIEAESARRDAEESAGKETKAKRLAEERRVDAENQRDIARNALADAETQRKLAVAAAEEAQKQSLLAKNNAAEAEKQRQSAVAALADAQVQRRRAEAALVDAQVQRERAVAAAAEADKQRKKAEEAAAVAETERKKAEQQKILVEQQKKLAEQSQLISQALAAQKDDRLLQHSVLLAREALRPDKFENYSIDAYQALFQGLSLLPHPLASYTGQFSDVAFSPDGRYLLSGLRNDSRFRGNSADGSPKVTDLTNVLTVFDDKNKEYFRQSFPALTSIVFSPDKKYVATSNIPIRTRGTGDFSNVNVTITNANVTVNTNRGSVNSNRAGGNSNAAAVNGNSAANTKSSSSLNSSLFNSNRFNSNNPTNASFSATIWEWEGGQLSEVKSITLGSRVDAIALSPTGKRLAVARQPLPPQAKARGVTPYKPAGFFFGDPQQPQAKPPEPFISLIDIEDPARRAEVITAPGQLTSNSVNAITFSASGRFIAAAQEDGTWVVWAGGDEEKYHLVSHGKHGASVTAIAISPDEKYLATAGNDNAVRVWPLEEGKKDASATDFRDASFTALIFGKPYADIEVSDANPLVTIKGHRDRINAVVFSPTGKYLATASDDDTARLWKGWKGSTPIEVARMTHDGAVTSLSFDGGESKVATASTDGTTRVWEVPGTAKGVGGDILAEVNVRQLIGTALSRNGRFVSISDSESSRMWDTTTGKEIFRMDSKPGAAQSTSGRVMSDSISAISNDGRYLVIKSGDESSGASSKSLRLWDREENRVLWNWDWGTTIPDYYTNVSFNSNGKYIAVTIVTLTRTPTSLVIDTLTGKEVLRLAPQDNQERVLMEFTPDGDHVVSKSGDGILHILELKSGRQVKEWKGDVGATDIVSSTGSVKEGKGYLAVTADDGSIRVWEVLSGRLVNYIKRQRDTPYMRITFSPDGEHFALTGPGETQLWKIGDDTRPAVVIPSRSGMAAGFVSFDSTGEFIAINGGSTVSVWKASTGCEVARMASRGGFITPDGRHVLLATDNYLTWRMWRPDDLIAEVCNHITRNLSLTEWRNQYMLKMDLPKTCENLKQDTQVDDEQIKSCDLAEIR